MKYLPISLGLCLLMPLLAQAQATKEVPPILVPAQIPQRGKAMVPLQKLVIAALERSPGTREAQANWRAAVQDVAQARGALWPRVDLNANTAATKLDGGKAAALSGGVGAPTPCWISVAPAIRSMPNNLKRRPCRRVCCSHVRPRHLTRSTLTCSW